jgi:hypothetical protein
MSNAWDIEVVAGAMGVIPVARDQRKALGEAP